MIKGYKCFNGDLTNRYGMKFNVGETYETIGDVKFGLEGNGFHFCENFEDTLRYFDAKNEEVAICEVIGFGNTISYEDDYNGYYDMYASEKISIIKLLSRKEIIDLALKLNSLRVVRFIQGFKLTEEEIELFKNTFQTNASVIKAIEYYQLGNTNVYSR